MRLMPETAAAARAQAPIVAVNVIAQLKGEQNFCKYNGYGSCPLTVERGKIVLAEFGYGGKLLPSFPKWVIDGQNLPVWLGCLKSRFYRQFTGKACLKAVSGWPNLSEDKQSNALP